MNKAKVLVIDAEEIADACEIPVYKVCRDRKNKVFNFDSLRSVATYIGMNRAKRELETME